MCTTRLRRYSSVYPQPDSFITIESQCQGAISALHHYDGVQLWRKTPILRSACLPRCSFDISDAIAPAPALPRSTTHRDLKKVLFAATIKSFATGEGPALKRTSEISESFTREHVVGNTSSRSYTRSLVMIKRTSPSPDSLRRDPACSAARAVEKKGREKKFARQGRGEFRSRAR